MTSFYKSWYLSGECFLKEAPFLSKGCFLSGEEEGKRGVSGAKLRLLLFSLLLLRLGRPTTKGALLKSTILKGSSFYYPMRLRLR